jgi:DNA-binding NarL/FixJ family response regulator
MIRVLIADDHDFVRSALSDLLSATADISVVATCSDGCDVVETAARTAPDVILMDLSMPVLNGLDATRLLREVVPDTAIVVFSAFDSPELKRQAFAAGAVAYLPKGCTNERLRATLEAAVTLASSHLRRP